MKRIEDWRKAMEEEMRKFVEEHGIQGETDKILVLPLYLPNINVQMNNTNDEIVTKVVLLKANGGLLFIYGLNDNYPFNEIVSDDLQDVWDFMCWAVWVAQPYIWRATT